MLLMGLSAFDFAVFRFIPGLKYFDPVSLIFQSFVQSPPGTQSRLNIVNELELIHFFNTWVFRRYLNEWKLWLKTFSAYNIVGCVFMYKIRSFNMYVALWRIDFWPISHLIALLNCSFFEDFHQLCQIIFHEAKLF